MARMSISVALATRNGQHHLSEQLDSLAAQSRAPDELVVVDDASSDGTVALLQAFSQTAPFDVRVLRNPERVGHRRAFLAAAAECRGALVAFCDQDDFWQPDKLARCEAALAADPGVVLVAHSGRLADARLAPTRVRYPDIAARAVRHPASPGLRAVWPGFSLVCSRRLLDASAALSAWDETYEPDDPRELLASHDWWICAVAAAVGKVALLPDELVLHRVHSTNTSGVTLPGLSRHLRRMQVEPDEMRRRRAAAARAEAALVQRAVALDLAPPPAARRAELLNRYAAHWEQRARVYEPSARLDRWEALLALLRGGGYRAEHHGGLAPRALAKDLAVVCGWRWRDQNAEKMPEMFNAPAAGRARSSEAGAGGVENDAAAPTAGDL